MGLLQHLRVCRGAPRCCSSAVLAGCDDQALGVSQGLLPAQGRLQMLQHQLSLELNKPTHCFEECTCCAAMWLL